MIQKNIIQFLPYYPPHKWWLETHAQQWAFYWSANNYWKVYNIITDIDQDYKDKEKIIFKWKTIWYKENNIENLVVPSFEIIPNFPMYKIWTKKYKLIKKYLKTKKINIVITRTRFFLTSFIGWIFAKNNNIKWTHIEHGSDYVKLNSKFKTSIAKIYDKIIWKWIFKKSDILVWVSYACKDFIQNEFIDRKIYVIYRWLDFNINNDSIKSDDIKNKYKNKIIVWFLGRLYKWKNVDTLIKAYYNLDKHLQNKIQLVVVWDGEDFDRLNKLDIDKNIYFTWWKSFDEAIKLQSQFDIHFHTSSPGWWLATTLLQAMKLWCFIVSTPYEWASEVIKNNYNWILLKDDSLWELKKWLIEWIKSSNKRKEFALKNKEIIQNQFSWNENIKKYYDLFLK